MKKQIEFGLKCGRSIALYFTILVVLARIMSGIDLMIVLLLSLILFLSILIDGMQFLKFDDIDQKNHILSSNLQRFQSSLKTNNKELKALNSEMDRLNNLEEDALLGDVLDEK